MPDYSQGKIYIIRSFKTTDVYIGSTTQTLSRRMSKHRQDLKHKKGNTSEKILQHEDAYIELLEDFPCENVEQLRRREGDWIRKTTERVNKCIAGQTSKEYWTSEKGKQSKKRYKAKPDVMEKARLFSRKRRTNPDVIQREKEYNKKRNSTRVQCSCGQSFLLNHKARHEKTKRHQENAVA